MTLDWWSPLFVGQLSLAGTAFALAFVVELTVPASRNRSWRALGFNLVAAFVFLYLTTLLVPPVSAALEPLRARLGHAIPIRFPDGQIGSILQTLAFFATFDFFFYWWHRGQHRYAWLWTQHRFHHQERWINVTTVHRYHFTEELFRLFVIYLPMGILFDFKPVTVTWFWSMFTLWGYWIHMNVRAELGPLGRWVSGPQFHRLHHTPEHGDRNYAAFFPMWDRLFGTYRHADRGVFPAITGVTAATDGNTLYEATLMPLIEWCRSLGRALGRAARASTDP